jgi:hypothetical protein
LQNPGWLGSHPCCRPACAACSTSMAVRCARVRLRHSRFIPAHRLMRAGRPFCRPSSGAVCTRRCEPLPWTPAYRAAVVDGITRLDADLLAHGARAPLVLLVATRELADVLCDERVACRHCLRGIPSTPSLSAAGRSRACASPGTPPSQIFGSSANSNAPQLPRCQLR